MAFAFTKRELASLGAALGTKPKGNKLHLEQGLQLEANEREVCLTTSTASVRLRNCISYRTDAAGCRALLLFRQDDLALTELRLTRGSYSITSDTTEQNAVAQWEANMSTQAAGAVMQALSAVQSRLCRTRSDSSLPDDWSFDDDDWAAASEADVGAIDRQLARGSEYDELVLRLKTLKVPRIGKSIRGCMSSRALHQAMRDQADILPAIEPRPLIFPEHPILAKTFTPGPSGLCIDYTEAGSATAQEEDAAHAEVWAQECTGEPWLERIRKMLEQAQHPLGGAAELFRQQCAAGVAAGKRAADTLHNIKLFSNEFVALTSLALRLPLLPDMQQQALATVFEQALMPPVYPALIETLRVVNSASDQQYWKSLQGCAKMSVSEFGASSELQVSDQALGSAVQCLTRIPEQVSATSKALLILQACVLLVEGCMGEPIGADDLVPLLAFATVQAGVKDMPTQLCYVEHLLGRDAGTGEVGYFLTTMHVVVGYLTSLN